MISHPGSLYVTEKQFALTLLDVSAHPAIKFIYLLLARCPFQHSNESLSDR